MAKDEFKLLETVLCPECKAQNLSWAMACWECGKDLFDEDDSADRHKQDNAA